MSNSQQAACPRKRDHTGEREKENLMHQSRIRKGRCMRVLAGTLIILGSVGLLA